MVRTHRGVQTLASALIILLGLVVCCALIGGMTGGSSRRVVLESLDADEETVSCEVSPCELYSLSMRAAAACRSTPPRAARVALSVQLPRAQGLLFAGTAAGLGGASTVRL